MANIHILNGHLRGDVVLKRCVFHFLVELAKK